jgi:hypothetical protein
MNIYNKLPNDIQERIDTILLKDRNYNDYLEIDLYGTKLFNNVFYELPFIYIKKRNIIKNGPEYNSILYDSEDYRIFKWFCYVVLPSRKWGEWVRVDGSYRGFYRWDVEYGVNKRPLLFNVMAFIEKKYDTEIEDLEEAFEEFTEAVSLATDNWIFENLDFNYDITNLCEKLKINPLDMMEHYLDTTGDYITEPKDFRKCICFYIIDIIKDILDRAHKYKNHSNFIPYNNYSNQ